MIPVAALRQAVHGPLQHRAHEPAVARVGEHPDAKSQFLPARGGGEPARRGSGPRSGRSEINCSAAVLPQIARGSDAWTRSSPSHPLGHGHSPNIGVDVHHIEEAESPRGTAANRRPL